MHCCTFLSWPRILSHIPTMSLSSPSINPQSICLSDWCSYGNGVLAPWPFALLRIFAVWFMCVYRLVSVAMSLIGWFLHFCGRRHGQEIESQEIRDCKLGHRPVSRLLWLMPERFSIDRSIEPSRPDSVPWAFSSLPAWLWVIRWKVLILSFMRAHSHQMVVLSFNIHNEIAYAYFDESLSKDID